MWYKNRFYFYINRVEIINIFLFEKNSKNSKIRVSVFIGGNFGEKKAFFIRNMGFEAT